MSLPLAIAKKNTNVGMKFTASAKSAKKTTAKKTTAKKTAKNATPKSAGAKTKAANIPAFLPKYPDYRLSDIVATIEMRNDAMGESLSCI